MEQLSKVTDTATKTADKAAGTSRFAGGTDLMDLPPGVDLVTGVAPDLEPVPRTRLRRLELVDLAAVRDDGTIGVSGANLTVEAGELVLLVGRGVGVPSPSHRVTV